MIKGVLLDLGGVVFTGDAAIAGAVAAVAELRSYGLPVRFITNTTRQTVESLRSKLAGFGLQVSADEVLAPAAMARQYLADRDLSARLLIHPALRPDFEHVRDGGGAVLVGDAADAFTYAALNGAFRALEAGAEFLALAHNRSFRDADGQLSLDAGPFVAALEYATGRQAIVLGKPSPEFFAAALASVGCSAAEAVMVGDDVEADVGAAMALGLAGVLVRTGKYAAGDENKIDPHPSAVVTDLAEAARWILTKA